MKHAEGLVIAGVGKLACQNGQDDWLHVLIADVRAKLKRMAQISPAMTIRNVSA